MDRRWILVAAACVLALGSGLWFGSGTRSAPGHPPAVPVSSPLVEDTAASTVVHVSGWVARPGVVEVPEGSRVSDAIAAAGGARPGVDLTSLNLARVVADGQQIVVPSPGEGPVAGVPSADVDSGPLSLNAATAQDLEQLPGVGPVLAERIIAHRDSRGGFDRVEDLLEVPGIGEAKLASIRDLVAP